MSKFAVGADKMREVARWAAQKAQLQNAAVEQVAADIAFVEASRAAECAHATLTGAILRKNTAEKKLSTLRANFGGK